MDVTTPIITTTAATTTPETETETPPTKLTDHHHHHHHHRNHSKVLSFTNGALKQHHHHHSTTPPVVVYKECLKNHAATLGGHAVDGCGEFMPSPTTNPTDPTSLKCAACGCHRNFHRRDPDEGSTHIIEYHHHLPPPPPLLQPPRVRSPNSVSPPPISSSYYPSSAPHMLLALSTGVAGKPDTHPMVNNTTTPINMGNRNEGSNNKKRFRTKFSVEQKEKMQIFAERLGWKMQKRDERLVEDFCNEIGVCRGVLKVWMHNNKHTFGKRDHVNSSSTSNPHNNNNNDNNNNNNSHNNHNNHHGCSAPVVTNGSSSSS